MDKWGVSLKYLMSAVIVLGGVVLGAYNHMQRKASPPPLPSLPPSPVSSLTLHCHLCCGWLAFIR